MSEILEIKDVIDGDTSFWVDAFVEEVKGGTFEVFIDSVGGDVDATNHIRSVLLGAAGQIEKVNVGNRCWSCAANLLAALRASGAKVSVSPYTEIMYHSAFLEFVTDLNADLAKSLGKMLELTNAAVVSDLANVGVDAREWFAGNLLHWIGPEEAVQIGLADDMDFTAAKADFDRNKYRMSAKLVGGKVSIMAEEIKEETPAVEETQPTVEAPKVVEAPPEEKQPEAPEAPKAEEETKPAEPTPEETIKSLTDEIDALKAKIVELEAPAKETEQKPEPAPCAALSRPKVTAGIISHPARQASMVVTNRK